MTYGIKIGFIGTGRMGEALIRAFAASKVKPRNIFAYNRTERKLTPLRKIGITVVKDNLELVERCDVIFICVKPQQIKEVIEEIKGTNKLIVSIAAGIKLSYLEKHFDKVARVMPNVSVQVNEVAAAYTAGKNMTQKQKQFIEKLFGNVGMIVEVKEKYMSGVTALSGSGPAFIAYFVYAMMRAAQKYGLKKEDAKTLAVQTCLGSAKMMKDLEMSPGELIAMVASRGGTTEAGLKILKSDKFEQIVEDTFNASKDRANELGKQKNWNPSYIREELQ